MTLTELIKDNYVSFDSLRQGFAYYTLWVRKAEEEIKTSVSSNTRDYFNGYTFTIPLDDIGNGTLRFQMKAIECMRWIRKAHESGELIKIK